MPRKSYRVCELPSGLGAWVAVCTGFTTPAANRLIFGGAMCVGSVLAVAITWFTHYAAQPGGVRANLDYWEVQPLT